MARLTTFSRLLITLAIVGGVYFAVTKYLPQFQKNSSAPATTEQPATSGGDQRTNDDAGSGSTAQDWGKSGSANPGAATYTPQAFNYTPPSAANGKLKGVVELGATGFNSFIVRIDGQKNWQLEKAEYGASLVYEKLATDDDIKSGLKRYIADMLGFGVGAKDIHFVISSGAKKIDITQKISAELKRMGYFVNDVTPQQEAQYALKAALPKAYTNRAFVVDIGSGNTKISWLPGGALEGPGAKYFQNNQTDGDVYQQTKALANQVPNNLRATCFIIGGVPYELAKQTRNGKERYTVLKAPSAYTADGAKQKAGLNILSAIADATGCKQFVFDWDANFTIGFLLGM
ncbi:MAG TPA: hypothetical protein PKD78_01740 [Saprospiraceae bacterium]|nr:hypothetical protein [Saprospiraceae bacterium]